MDNVQADEISLTWHHIWCRYCGLRDYFWAVMFYVPKWAGKELNGSFHTQSVLDSWNKQPEEVVYGSTITTFKCRLDRYVDRKGVEGWANGTWTTEPVGMLYLCVQQPMPHLLSACYSSRAQRPVSNVTCLSPTAMMLCFHFQPSFHHTAQCCHVGWCWSGG